MVYLCFIADNMANVISVGETEQGSIWEDSIASMKRLAGTHSNEMALLEDFRNKKTAKLAELKKVMAGYVEERTKVIEDLKKEQENVTASIAKVAELVALETTLALQEIELQNELNMLSTKISLAKKNKEELRSKLGDFHSAYTRMTSDLNEYLKSEVP